MGYIFEHRDRAIWWPSKLVAEIFLAEVKHLEVGLKIQSGLKESMSDTIEVDFDALNTFLQGIRDWIKRENDSLRILVRGTVVHLLALILCGDGTHDNIEANYPDGWIEEAKLLAHGRMAMTEPIPI